jgi:hypothetical protein
MKKIIIGLIVAVAVVIPFHVSLVSAADSFFGSGATNQSFGTNGSAVANNSSFGSGSGYTGNDLFFGSGNTNQPFGGVSNTAPADNCFFGSGCNTAGSGSTFGTCTTNCNDPFFGSTGSTYTDPFTPSCSPFSCGLLCDNDPWCDVSPAPAPNPCPISCDGSIVNNNGIPTYATPAGNSNTIDNSNTNINESPLLKTEIIWAKN